MVDFLDLSYPEERPLREHYFLEVSLWVHRLYVEIILDESEDWSVSRNHEIWLSVG